MRFPEAVAADAELVRRDPERAFRRMRRMGEVVEALARDLEAQEVGHALRVLMLTHRMILLNVELQGAMASGRWGPPGRRRRPDLPCPALACYHDFPDEDAAFEYAVANQRDRRNLTPGDVLRLVEAVDRRKERGGGFRGNRHTGGKNLVITPPGVITRRATSSEETGRVIGIAARAVERARTILDHAPEPIKEEVREGKRTISSAYKATIKARKPKESKGDGRPKRRPLFAGALIVRGGGEASG